jgi:hypothetical protein
MTEENASASITAYYQQGKTYGSPIMPDFLKVARDIERLRRTQLKGVTVNIQRVSDKYRVPLTVMGTQDIDVVMTRACKYRDELIAKTGEDWVVLRPGEEIKGVPLTAENKAAIDQKIMTGPDCFAKTFLIARYARLSDEELKVNVAPPKPQEFYADGELKRFLSDGSLAPKRNFVG